MEEDMSRLSDSIKQTLQSRHYATLATHNEDGTIHTTPVWYLFENNTFYVGSNSSSRKTKNVVARPNATIMIDVRRPGGESWVYASGRVKILEGDSAREITSKILRRYLTDEAMGDPRIGPVFEATDDTTICVVPEKWRSWNSRDVDERFFGGILTSTPEKWFRPVDR